MAKGKRGGRAGREQRREGRLPRSATLGEIVHALAPALDESETPDWPPDVFALVSAILQRADAYRSAINRKRLRAGWEGWARELGTAWRQAAAAGRKPPPAVQRLWKAVVRQRKRPLRELADEERPDLSEALLALLAIADEACRDIGTLTPRAETSDKFQRRALGLLASDPSTLCERIDASRAVVFPKQSVPQSGLTIRGLSRHLALVEKPEVRVAWNSTLLGDQDSEDTVLNLLLLPWPEEIRPTQFHKVESPWEGFGSFACDLRPRGSSWIERADSVFRRAKRMVGRVDMIVFPELALRPGEARKLCKRTKAIVIGGVGDARTKANRIEGAIPYLAGDPVPFQQDKHHHWKLDESQIVQYGISPQLSPLVKWWESFAIQPRTLTFWNPRQWLTTCALICEDLARPDPAADVIRSIGPNLVIAVLLDGPQLEKRWPARYATVLADDPGSSVLTLTSLGMALLSRPSDRPPSRMVALWKEEGSSGAREIFLPERCAGLVLTLRHKDRTQWTADGRKHEHGNQIVWSGCTEVPAP